MEYMYINVMSELGNHLIIENVTAGIEEGARCAQLICPEVGKFFLSMIKTFVFQCFMYHWEGNFNPYLGERDLVDQIMTDNIHNYRYHQYFTQLMYLLSRESVVYLACIEAGNDLDRVERVKTIKRICSEFIN